MIDRRELMIGGAALWGLAACGGPAGPGAVTVNASAGAGMNPGPDGADRPLTLTVVQLRSSAAFDGADVFALQDPATALGADLVKADQIALAPGASETKVIPLDPTTTVIGVIAGYRDPAGKAFRAKAGVDPTATVAFNVSVTSSGVTMAPG